MARKPVEAPPAAAATDPADWAPPPRNEYGMEVAADGLPLGRAARLAALTEAGATKDALGLVTAEELAAYRGPPAPVDELATTTDPEA